ncbi:Peptidyl-tRNA hydrolase 2 mitochondrial [Caligus rogercresseyi]|uniref:peptidyl-tRNA hydrolase n=1 Tax=Caligus rogercresseyi TaxID=217165 RepID=A0A7T8QX21_CALRO|nr:Peptidyl-tRNA hydrolase 2 mitochondrial [Caligus rogercresseyi]
MVFLVRTDIQMGKGKMALKWLMQPSLAYQSALNSKSEHLTPWESSGQMKVVLKVSSEEELRHLYEDARAQGLTTSIVRDAGRTQIDFGTLTAVGIGPGPVDVIDGITGHLKLFDYTQCHPSSRLPDSPSNKGN